MAVADQVREGVGDGLKVGDPCLQLLQMLRPPAV